MRVATTALMGLVLGQCAGYCQIPEAGAASPLAWEDVSSWANVHRTETDNIVFANVPLIPNPSASPDPGTPNGILPAAGSHDGPRAPGVLPNGVPPPTPTQVNLPQNNLPNDPPLDPKLPTLFIVGDSTARNGPDLGWGDHLAHYFDTTRINVANRARAGRSSRSYIDEGLWHKTLAEIKPGDYVLLQWGHNDGGDLGGNKPRGDLPGDSDATQDVPQTTGPYAGQTETIHTYGWYNRKYVADIGPKAPRPCSSP